MIVRVVQLLFLLVVATIGFYLVGEVAQSPSPPSYRWQQRIAALMPAGHRVGAAYTPSSSSAPACEAPPAFTDAAVANDGSLAGAQWSVFGRPETGWMPYVPLVAREVGTSCAPQAPGFAAALARWQGSHGLQVSGMMDAATLRTMDQLWLARRPFVAATRQGNCPPPPPDGQLAPLQPSESYSGKVMRLDVRALAAYRRLVAAARADLPQLAQDPRLLTVFSAFRGPEEEQARCAQGAPCNAVTKARCSAHRTGMALDLFLGAPPGSQPDDTDDARRAALAGSAPYRWLVAHAAAFGFVPYPYEPWHWEYAG